MNGDLNLYSREDFESNDSMCFPKETDRSVIVFKEANITGRAVFWLCFYVYAHFLVIALCCMPVEQYNCLKPAYLKRYGALCYCPWKLGPCIIKYLSE